MLEVECVTCEDQGWIAVAEHVCEGDESICWRECPQQGQEQCPDCTVHLGDIGVDLPF